MPPARVMMESHLGQPGNCHRAAADLHLFHILGADRPVAVLVARIAAAYTVEVPQNDLLEARLPIDYESTTPTGPDVNLVLVAVEELDRVYAAQRDVNLTTRERGNIRQLLPVGYGLPCQCGYADEAEGVALHLVAQQAQYRRVEPRDDGYGIAVAANAKRKAVAAALVDLGLADEA